MSFGDNVRVKHSPETKMSGFEGESGQVFGETMPSVSGVSVIGKTERDFAFNVFFAGLNKGAWFAPHLLEFIDHAPGSTFSLEGGNSFVREADGGWREERSDLAPKANPWWKFWRP